MKKAKSWARVKKDFPGKACVRARVFVPVEGYDDGLEVTMEGTLPKGIAMLLAMSAMAQSPISPEMDAHLLDVARRMLIGTA